MDGTLSPDGKWVIHGMEWVPAMLSPDGGHYAHEGQWYPILHQSIPKAEDENVLHMTRGQLEKHIPRVLSVAMLVLALYSLTSNAWIELREDVFGPFGLTEFGPFGLTEGGVSMDYSSSSRGEDSLIWHIILKPVGYYVLVGASFPLLCILGIIGFQAGKISGRTATLFPLVSGVFLLLTPVVLFLSMSTLGFNDYGGASTSNPFPHIGDAVLFFKRMFAPEYYPTIEPNHFSMGSAFYSILISGIIGLALYRFCSRKFTL